MRMHWSAVIDDRSRAAHDCGLALAFGARRSRKAFVITDSELRLIATVAIIGESSQPVNGQSTPAARGTPSAL